MNICDWCSSPPLPPTVVYLDRRLTARLCHVCLFSFASHQLIRKCLVSDCRDFLSSELGSFCPRHPILTHLPRHPEFLLDPL